MHICYKDGDFNWYSSFSNFVAYNLSKNLTRKISLETAYTGKYVFKDIFHQSLQHIGINIYFAKFYRYSEHYSELYLIVNTPM